MLFTKGKEKHKVLAFDEEMTLLWEKNLEFELKRANVVDVIPQKKTFTVVYKFSKGGQTHLKALRFDSSCERADTSLIKVIDRWSYAVNPEIILSEDKKLALFYESTQNKSLEAYAFDLEKMELVWEQEFYPKFFDYHENFIQVVFNNQANLHIVMGTKNRKVGKEKNHFRIFQFHHKDRSTKEYQIRFEEHFWFDVEFYYDNLNEQLSAGGLCSDLRHYEVNGAFHLRVPEGDPEKKQISFHAFDDSFMTQIMGKRFRRNTGFSEVKVRELVLRKDGGLLMIAERFKKQVRSSGGLQTEDFRNNTNAQIDYQVNDIILVSLHPSGKIHWKTVLHKRQFSQDDEAQFSSYFLLKTRQSLRFLYNDEIDPKASINEYVVGGNGKQIRQTLKLDFKEDLLLELQNGLQISSDKFIVPSYNRNGLKIALLNY